jgi:nucleoid DNA-binding protein
MFKKKVFWVPFLVVGGLATSNGLFGMKENQWDIQDQKKWELHTSVSRLAREGNIEKINLLLNNDSICDLISFGTFDQALRNAVFGNHIDVANAIVKVAEIKKISLDIISPLKDAIYNDKIELVLMLLELNQLPIQWVSVMLEDAKSEVVKDLLLVVQIMDAINNNKIEVIQKLLESNQILVEWVPEMLEHAKSDEVKKLLELYKDKKAALNNELGHQSALFIRELIGTLANKSTFV